MKKSNALSAAEPSSGMPPLENVKSTSLTVRLPQSGTGERQANLAIVLRDLGLEKSSLVVTLVAKRPKSEQFLLLAGAKPLNAEDTTLCRSVTTRPVGAIGFEPQTLPGVLEVFCDADHAGDLGTQKSRSVAVWEAHLIKHGSAVSTIALSSGESEYYALLRSAHTLGIKAMLNGITEWNARFACVAITVLQGSHMLDKDCGKLDMLMCASCGYKLCRKDV